MYCSLKEARKAEINRQVIVSVGFYEHCYTMGLFLTKFELFG